MTSPTPWDRAAPRAVPIQSEFDCGELQAALVLAVKHEDHNDPT